MKFLRMDSPLMHFLSKVADVVIINLLTIVLCIPVITVGAAFTAMHYSCLKIVRGEESSIVQLYFHSFKDNFKQSTIIWLTMLVIWAFLGFDFFFLYTNVSVVGSYVFWGLLVIAILFAMVCNMVYPLQAKFANPIRRTWKLAFVYSIRHLPSTIIIAIVTVIPFAGMYYLMIILPLFLCVCFSGPGMIAAALYNKPFKKIEDKYRAAHPEEFPDEEDEHIFDDAAEIAAEEADKKAKEAEKKSK